MRRILLFVLLFAMPSTLLAQGMVGVGGPTEILSGQQYQKTFWGANVSQMTCRKGGFVIATNPPGFQYTYTTTDSVSTSTYYNYWVEGWSNGTGSHVQDSQGIWVIADTQVPTVPQGLTYSNLSESGFTLHWQASTDDYSSSPSYIVSISGGGEQTAAGSTSYIFTGLSPHTTYAVKVRSKDAAGNLSNWSQSLNVTVPDVTAPTTPTGLQATAVDYESISVQWNSSTDNVGVDFYEVRINGSVDGLPTSTQWTFTGLDPATEYDIAVRARDVADNWGSSATLNDVETDPLSGFPSYSDLVISNENYTSGITPVSALNSITASPNVTVASGAEVNYTAGTRITLGPGFHAAGGSTFRAKIGDDITDNDRDGMADIWEAAYGLNPNTADAMVDTDGDGLSNIAEYHLKRSPTSAQSPSTQTGAAVPVEWPTADQTAVKAVGATVGELAVTPTGSASYSVPIWVSPGTAGMEPEITVNYSSQSGNGIMGLGWSLGGLSAVSRGPKTMAVDGTVHGMDFSYDDRFYLDGQRLILIEGAYGANGAEYRTEIDTFSRIISHGNAGSGPAWLEAKTKSGLTIEFGNTTDSKLVQNTYNSSTKAWSAGTTVHSWAVSKIYDTFGNYMTFQYSLDSASGEQLIERIDYTGKAGDGEPVSPYASVRFKYEERQDEAEVFMAGSRQVSAKRLKRIVAYYESTPVRTYEMSYIERSNTGRSMLTSIKEIGKNDKELRPLTFDYSESEVGWTVSSAYAAFTSNASIDNELVLVDNDAEKPTGAGFIDLNGDGLTDFVYHKSGGQNVAYLNNGSDWALATGYQTPYQLSNSDGTDSGARFADVNGDGLVDFLWRKSGGGSGVRLNSGSGWTTVGASAWSLPAPVAKDSEPLKKGRFVDIDGDGLVDYVAMLPPVSGTYGSYDQWVYLNTGSGWSSSPHDNFSNPPSLGFDLAAKQPRFVDLTGDGLPELVVHYRTGDGTSPFGATVQTWRNEGDGWVVDANLELPLPIAAETQSVFGTEFADANFDGLVDMVWSSGAAMNTGTGWIIDNSSDYQSYSQRFKAGMSLADLNYNDDMVPGAAQIDLNGDGMPDWVGSWEELYFGSPSNRLKYGASQGHGVSDFSEQLPAYLALANGKYGGLEFVDLNGDGVSDLVQRVRHEDGSVERNAWINTASQADRLIRVTNGFGVDVEIEYATLTDSSIYSKSSNLAGIDSGEQQHVVNVAGPMVVVSAVNHDDGAGGDYTFSYTYGGLRAHRERGSLGFEWTGLLDERTDILSVTQYQQNFPFVGMPTEAWSQTDNGSGVVISESTVVYADKLLNLGKTHFPFAATSVSTTYDPVDGGKTSETTTVATASDFDSYGNALYVEVDTAGGYSKKTTSEYDNDTDNWFLGRLTSSEVESIGPSSTITRKSSFTYDPDTGVLVTETVEPDSANVGIKVTNTFGYDGFGNKISSTVSDTDSTTVDRTTATEYDSDGRFLVKNTNALDHEESFETDPEFGVVTSRTGPNNLTTTFELDDFGRVVKETRHDDTFTVVERNWANSNAPADAAYYVETRDYHNPLTPVPVSAPAVEFFDKFGRSIRGLGVNGDGRAVATDTDYDSFGRAYRTTVPYYVDSQTAFTQTAFTQTFFDDFGRPVTVRSPDDEVGAGYVETQYSYSSLSEETNIATAIGSVARVVNPKGVTNKTVANSQGWTVEIVQNEDNLDFDAGSAEKTTLTHTYDPLGQLLTTSTEGSTIDNVYDDRGRRISTTDPNTGHWEYDYNAYGELVWQEDAKGNVTTLKYDKLGRMTEKLDADEKRVWTYDTSPTKGVGQLYKAEVWNAAEPTLKYCETHVYDTLGRPSSVTRKIDSTDYTVSFSYDNFGRLADTTYPTTGYKTRNGYNANGVLKEVRRVDGGRNEVLWSAASSGAYNAAGGLETYFLGNGVSTERVYSTATGRLRAVNTGRLQTTALAVDREDWGYDVQRLDYDYDVVGNIDVRDDGATGINQTFSYDALNRLTEQVTATALTFIPASISVDYAANGNIAHKSDVGDYAYHASRKHAVATAGGDSYSYDANGSMTSCAGRTIAYTRFNKVKSISASGGAFSTFTFDASGSRITHESQKGDTVYVGGIYERFTPNGPGRVEHWHWVFTPAGRVAVHKTFEGSSTVATDYFHHDGISSVTAVTDPWGKLTQRYAYDAWGKRFDPEDLGISTWADAGFTWASDAAQMTRGFTDHEQLDELGLVHMNGRVYDPTLGRFLSADPFVDGVDDSQGYNRYSYVHNNPLNATDPSGYLSFKDVLKIVAVVAVSVVTAGAAVMAGAAIVGQTGVTFGVALNAIAGVNGFALTGLGATVAGAGAGFGAGFASSLLNGGSLGDAFKSGVTGAIFGAISGGLAHKIGSMANWQVGEKALAHGALQGSLAEAQGGEFRHGFYSGFFAKTAAGPISGRVRGVAGQTVAAAVVGGTVSSIGGGKFANGAVSGAFTYLFNQRQSQARSPQSQSTGNAGTDAKLAQGVYDPNFTGADGYSVVSTHTHKNGLRAVLFTNGTDNVLVYAGTSASSRANWFANLKQAFGFKSAQYEMGIDLAVQLSGQHSNLRFAGHSLGGGLASAAAIVTGGSANTFNAAGVHRNTLRGFARSNGTINSYYSTTDVLRLGNFLSPASVPGNRISLGFAGFHGIGPVVDALNP